MIVLSNTTAQTLQPGDSITFDISVMHTGTGECCQMPNRLGSTSVKMKNSGIYILEFHGNVTTATADALAQLNITVGGETLAETTMKSTTVAANSFSNVGAATRFKNCCCEFDRVGVTNTGTTAVIVDANSALIVGRVA